MFPSHTWWAEGTRGSLRDEVAPRPAAPAAPLDGDPKTVTHAEPPPLASTSARHKTVRKQAHLATKSIDCLRSCFTEWFVAVHTVEFYSRQIRTAAASRDTTATEEVSSHEVSAPTVHALRKQTPLATVLPGTHYAAFLSGSQRRHREPREGPWNPHRHVGKLREPTPGERLLAALGPSGGHCYEKPRVQASTAPRGRSAPPRKRPTAALPAKAPRPRGAVEGQARLPTKKASQGHRRPRFLPDAKRARLQALAKAAAEKRLPRTILPSRRCTHWHRSGRGAGVCRWAARCRTGGRHDVRRARRGHRRIFAEALPLLLFATLCCRTGGGSADTPDPPLLLLISQEEEPMFCQSMEELEGEKRQSTDGVEKGVTPGQTSPHREGSAWPADLPTAGTPEGAAASDLSVL